METKPFYKSKEVYVLLAAILFGFAQINGVEVGSVTEQAQEWALIGLPVLTLILRVFFTKTKLSLK